MAGNRVATVTCFLPADEMELVPPCRLLANGSGRPLPLNGSLITIHLFPSRPPLHGIAGVTPAATVSAYAVQKCRAATRRKNYENRKIGGTGPADHSVHPRGWHRSGHLGSQRARVRCRGRESFRCQKEGRLVRGFRGSDCKGQIR